MELDEKVRKRLETCSITEDDALAILEWQLSLPAEEIDCDLIRECDLFLSPDAEGLDPERSQALYERILGVIDSMPKAPVHRRRPAPTSAAPAPASPTSASPAPKRRPHPRTPHPRRPGKLLAAVLLAALLLALSIGGVAYTYHRGVLNFTEDFGFAPMVAQEGAEDFVRAGALAHAEFDHVIVDVLEAVYDGAELRVVYSLTDKSGTITLSEHMENGYEMPGVQEGEVHMCDFIRVNDQDAYFNNTWEMPGDKPGQILYYLQTNLPAWGVDIGDAETMTIGLPMLPGSDVIEFTIPSAVPEGLVRGATIRETTVGGYPVTVEKAVFSPLNGFIQLRIDGIDEQLYYHKLTNFASVYAMDGSELTSCSSEGPCGYADGHGTFAYTIVPPEGDWPEEMILALEWSDYSPDWEVTVCVEPKEP